MARALVSKSSITGEVRTFAGSTAPEGYLLCQGQTVSRTTYSALFSVLGTSYGQGDGSTTFNLPDYRGTFLRGRVNVSTILGTGTASSSNATFTAHGLNRTGFKVRLSSGVLSGLAVSTDYYAIVVDSNTLAFATTLANAIAGTKVAISGANSAVIVQFEDPDYASRTAVTVGGNSSGGLGSVQDDALQGHWHNFTDSGGSSVTVSSSNNGGVGTTVRRIDVGGTGNLSVRNPVDNGTHGTPRTTSESRPKNSLINYIIKY